MKMKEADAKAVKALVSDMEAIKAKHADGAITGDDAAEFKRLSDELAEYKGQLDALDIATDLKAIVEAPLGAVPHVEAEKQEHIDREFKSLAAQVLGDRAEFKGWDPHDRTMREATVEVAKALITSGDWPTTTRLAPESLGEFDTYFADSLGSGTTGGPVEYMRYHTIAHAAAGVAEGLTGDNTKPESTYVYELIQEALKTVAHWVPVTTQALNDYGQMESTISTDLLIGLREAKDRDVLWGNGASGVIKGIFKVLDDALANDGQYDAAKYAKTGDQLFDEIRRMAMQSYLSSRVRPSHVAMDPIDKAELDTLKGDDEHYLYIVQGNSVWGLNIVETVAMTDPDDADVTRTMVYNGPVASTLFTRESANVSMGLIDKQFVQNARTLLAEERCVLAVRRPASFVWKETDRSAS